MMTRVTASLWRIAEVVRKEMTQILRDKRSFRLIIMAPVLQLFLYGYVVTTDVNRVKTIVLDQDRTQQSRGLVEKFSAGGFFDIGYYAERTADLDAALDSGRATIALVIPPGYARKLVGGEPAPLQIIVDGSNSNTATLSLSYAMNILAGESLKLAVERRMRAQAALSTGLVETRFRVWYNPELRSLLYMVPGVICMILLQLLVPLTAMNIVKEKENGTIEQLVVTPIHAFELIVGKTIPFVFVGYLSVGVIILTASLWYGIPVKGNLAELLLFSGVFILAMLGIGLVISATSDTQQQAMLSSQFFLIPNMLLSGFLFPISSMPKVMQAITTFIPLRYFLIVVRSLFLKGTGWSVLWPQVVVLIGFAALTLTVAVIVFRKNALHE
jgi:ABC-2 type transport system permease protein